MSLYSYDFPVPIFGINQNQAGYRFTYATQGDLPMAIGATQVVIAANASWSAAVSRIHFSSTGAGRYTFLFNIVTISIRVLANTLAVIDHYPNYMTETPNYAFTLRNDSGLAVNVSYFVSYIQVPVEASDPV